MVEESSRKVIAETSSDFSGTLNGGHTIVRGIRELHHLITEVVFKDMNGVLPHFEEDSRNIEGLLRSCLVIATDIETINKNCPMLPIRACIAVIVKECISSSF